MRRSESGSWINYCQPWLRHKESLPFVKKCSVSDYVIKEQGVIKGLVKKYFYLCNGTFFYLRRLKYTFLLKEMVTFIQCNIQLHTLDGTRNLPLTEEGGGGTKREQKKIEKVSFLKVIQAPTHCSDHSWLVHKLQNCWWSTFENCQITGVSTIYDSILYLISNMISWITVSWT